MKVLVTGAPGWLGTRLAEILQERERETGYLVLTAADDTPHILVETIEL